MSFKTFKSNQERKQGFLNHLMKNDIYYLTRTINGLKKNTKVIIIDFTKRKTLNLNKIKFCAFGPLVPVENWNQIKEVSLSFFMNNFTTKEPGND